MAKPGFFGAFLLGMIQLEVQWIDIFVSQGITSVIQYSKSVIVCKRMLFILRTQSSQTNSHPAGKATVDYLLLR
jgi:hypothetical protein